MHILYPNTEQDLINILNQATQLPLVLANSHNIFSSFKILNSQHRELLNIFFELIADWAKDLVVIIANKIQETQQRSQTSDTTASNTAAGADEVLPQIVSILIESLKLAQNITKKDLEFFAICLQQVCQSNGIACTDIGYNLLILEQAVKYIISKIPPSEKQLTHEALEAAKKENTGVILLPDEAFSITRPIDFISDNPHLKYACDKEYLQQLLLQVKISRLLHTLNEILTNYKTHCVEEILSAALAAKAIAKTDLPVKNGNPCKALGKTSQSQSFLENEKLLLDKYTVVTGLLETLEDLEPGLNLKASEIMGKFKDFFTSDDRVMPKRLAQPRNPSRFHSSSEGATVVTKIEAILQEFASFATQYSLTTSQAQSSTADTTKAATS